MLSSRAHAWLLTVHRAHTHCQRSFDCEQRSSGESVKSMVRFRGSRLTETDMGTGSTLARVLPALRVLPVLSPCSPRRRNRKAAQRGTLGENNEF